MIGATTASRRECLLSRVGSRRLRGVASAAVALAVLASGAPAQGLRGTVRDSVSRAPVVGAVVLLLGADGDTVARVLTDARGEYRFASESPRGSIRVLRIGYAPREMRVTGPDARADVGLLRLPTMLRPVSVRAAGRCPRRADQAIAFGLWEQARAALLASVVANAQYPSDKRRVRYEQVFDGMSDRIVRHAARIEGGVDAQNSFFAGRSASRFSAGGFTDDRDGERTWYGPDAEVILDPAFAQDYCLALVRAPRGRADEVGLAFTPAVRDRGRVDVAGVVWLDTARRVLSRVTFRYLGVEGPAGRAEPGGTVSYRELPSGIVLVDQWEFLLVGAEVDTAASDGLVTTTLRPRLSRIGGALAQVYWPDGTLWRASLGEFSGVAARRNGEPATGVTLRLDQTNYRAVVDSAGEFAMPDLVPGPYQVLVEEPRLASLDLLVPTSLTFEAARDSTFRARLVLPTVEELVRDRCTATAASAANATGFLIGRLFRQDGTTAADVELRLQAQQASGGGLVRSVRTRTADDGTFQWCDSRLQAGARLTLEVPMASGDPLSVAHTITSSLTVMRIGLP